MLEPACGHCVREACNKRGNLPCATHKKGAAMIFYVIIKCSAAPFCDYTLLLMRGRI